MPAKRGWGRNAASGHPRPPSGASCLFYTLAVATWLGQKELEIMVQCQYGVGIPRLCCAPSGGARRGRQQGLVFATLASGFRTAHPSRGARSALTKVTRCAYGDTTAPENAGQWQRVVCAAPMRLGREVKGASHGTAMAQPLTCVRANVVGVRSSGKLGGNYKGGRGTRPAPPLTPHRGCTQPRQAPLPMQPPQSAGATQGGAAAARGAPAISSAPRRGIACNLVPAHASAAYSASASACVREGSRPPPPVGTCGAPAVGSREQ
jgi:hypothetical protein